MAAVIPENKHIEPSAISRAVVSLIVILLQTKF